MSRDDTSLNFNIFLIKEEYKDLTAIIPKIRDFAQTKVVLGGSTTGNLYTLQRPKSQPKWLSIFDGHVTTLPQLATTNGIALLVVLLDKKQYFVLTFGHARHYLEPNSYEENFGLRVTLNSVPKDKMRSIDLMTFDALGRHTRTQASRMGTFADFGLNIDQDLLRAVTGAPSDPALGLVMSGRDALNVTVRATLPKLGKLLNDYTSKYQDISYRKDYPWIDHIAEVRGDHKSTIASLNERMLDRLRRSDYGQLLWMAVPEIVEWDRVQGFRYTSSFGEEPKSDLSIQDFMSSLRDPEDATVERLKSKRIDAVADDGQVIYHWPAYKCIYCEQELDGYMYLLTGGKWYRIAKDFAEEVDRDVARVSACKSVLLPSFQNETEDVYNIRVSRREPTKYALMDRKLISYGGGHSKVEFCDLFTSGGQMIHVKRYAGSSAVLSHLFQQGSVSASTWMSDEKFRQKVNELLPNAYRIADYESKPDASKYEVVFAIASDRKKLVSSTLPFFSKLSLRNVAKELRAYGYSVSFLHIPEPSITARSS